MACGACSADLEQVILGRLGDGVKRSHKTAPAHKLSTKLRNFLLRLG